MLRFLFSICIILVSLCAQAQSDSSFTPNPLQNGLDTKPSLSANPFKWENKKAKPNTASMLALVPGLGQLYNYKVFKAPIVTATNYWTLKSYIIARQDYLNLKALNDQVLANDLDHIVYLKGLNNTLVVADSSALPPEVTKARGLRNLHFAAFAFSYMLNIMDARVDAMTSNFEKHSPAKAAFRSALIPGYGQVYNRRYWKIPFIYGAASFFFYRYNKVSNEKRLINEAYIAKITDDPNYEGQYKNRNVNQLKLLIDQANLDLEKQIINLFIVYIANVVDASVDAHFTGFSVDDDINVAFQPYYERNTRSSGMSFVFHF